MHGVRTNRYKLIRYHGIWDTNEFYDLQEDPHELVNLAHDRGRRAELRRRFDDQLALEATEFA